MKGNQFRSQIQNIFKEGIQEYGTRYDCQKKLVWHYWSLNYSREECFKAISDWYFAHDHQSRTWRTNPDQALKNLRAAINSLYRNAEKKGYLPFQRKSWNPLRLPDVLNIRKIAREYRMQKFIFSLLLYALNHKDSKGEFRLPWKVIMTFDCCSTESYKGKMHFCVTYGLISIARQYYRQDHRARTYKVNFPFSEGGEPISSLEEGLKKLFSPRILKLQYSRSVYEKHFKQ
jgi:hypothetical protein